MVCASVNMVGLYSGGLIFGWAYIWNALSDSNMVSLWTDGGLIFGGTSSRRITVVKVWYKFILWPQLHDTGFVSERHQFKVFFQSCLLLQLFIYEVFV